jgi:hypothetical protein
MKMVLQLAVQDIGQLTYLVAPSGFHATVGSFTKNMDVLFL